MSRCKQKHKAGPSPSEWAVTKQRARVRVYTDGPLLSKWARMRVCKRANEPAGHLKSVECWPEKNSCLGLTSHGLGNLILSCSEKNMRVFFSRKFLFSITKWVKFLQITLTWKCDFEKSKIDFTIKHSASQLVYILHTCNNFRFTNFPHIGCCKSSLKLFSAGWKNYCTILLVSFTKTNVEKKSENAFGIKFSSICILRIAT